MHEQIIQAPLTGNSTSFLEGPVGSGKTSAAIQRLTHLMESGAPPQSILVLVPDQRSSKAYTDTADGAGPSAPVTVTTFYTLATTAVTRFWPILLESGLFKNKTLEPRFMTYETSQYLLLRLIRTKLEGGYFSEFSIRRQKILSEILDNLNKAALNGYPMETVVTRLSNAWAGPKSRLQGYQRAQECMQIFRDYTLENNLLDVSLVTHAFTEHLVSDERYWHWLSTTYRHVIADNLEETVPVAQDLIAKFIAGCDSATLVYDHDGGHRVFLGVDAESAYNLKETCKTKVEAPEGSRTKPHLLNLANRFKTKLDLNAEPNPDGAGPAAASIAGQIISTYRTDMIRAVAAKIIELEKDGVEPGEIAIVAPYVDGVMRFTLAEIMKTEKVPFEVVRSYERLRDEPLSRASLTLAALAHPGWGIEVSPYQVGEMLSVFLSDDEDSEGNMDPVRAAILAKAVLRGDTLVSAEDLDTKIRERVGFGLVDKYEQLQNWLATKPTEARRTDYLIRSLFSEVLSGPGYSKSAADKFSQLIHSMNRFEKVAERFGIQPEDVGHQYVNMIQEGVVAAQYRTVIAHEEERNAVTLVAPTYTFLLSGRTVKYQFWLDAARMTWLEPIIQPLTNPHALARKWGEDRVWSMQDDDRLRRQTLQRLVSGLCHRCTEGIFLCTSQEDINEAGDNLLLTTMQTILQEDR